MEDKSKNHNFDPITEAVRLTRYDGDCAGAALQAADGLCIPRAKDALR
jgi:hypothetical protein